MTDYAKVDWSRVRYGTPAPCEHGYMGAPSCFACLTPLLEKVIDEQVAEKNQEKMASLAEENKALRAEITERDQAAEEAEPAARLVYPKDP